jgi:AP2-associated kinase
MEYCSNGSLFHLLQRKDFDLTWPILFRLMDETVSGVNDLHSMEVPIVHRDLKSLNLLVWCST